MGIIDPNILLIMTVKSHSRMFSPIIWLWLLAAFVSTASATTETILGLVGRDFLLLAADAAPPVDGYLARRTLDRVDKIHSLFGVEKDNIWAAVIGSDVAVVERFVSLLRAKLALAEFRAGPGLDVEYHHHATSTANHHNPKPPSLSVGAAAHLARSLGLPVPCLLGGMRKADTPCLYWLDPNGALLSSDLPYAVQGYGSVFLWSVLDRHYRPDLTRAEAVALIRTCWRQLHTRSLVSTATQTPNIVIKCIDAHGCHVVTLEDDDQDFNEVTETVNDQDAISMAEE